MRKKPNSPRERIYRMRAQNGSYLAVYYWHDNPPVKNPDDIIEFEVRNHNEPINYFITTEEALHTASGLFLALVRHLDKLVPDKEYYDKAREEGRREAIELFRQWAKKHNLCSDLVKTSSLMLYCDALKENV